MPTKHSWLAVACLLLLLLLAWLHFGRTVDPSSRRPNVVLISIDSLRPDHLGAYGYRRPTSPNIDELASEGTLFETAIASSSWTLPSHASIFTSLNVPVHGVDEVGEKLPSWSPLLAEVLRDAGYATAGFYAIGLLSRGFGFHRGFDHYYNCTSHIGPQDEALETFKEQFGAGRPRVSAFADVTSPRIHETVSYWFEHQRREPFFLFIHYFDVHFDYVPPAPYDSMFGSGQSFPARPRDRRLLNDVGYPANPGATSVAGLVGLYDGEIRWTDLWIGKLMQMLRDFELLDHTMVILTADHGEEFGLHGAMYHGNNLFDETIHVPLVVRLPGVATAGARVAEQVRLIDIYPTILEVAGIDPGPHVQGYSLLPLLEGEGQQLPPAHGSLARIPWHRQNVPSESLRVRGSKLIRIAQSGRMFFFDLEQDPTERSAISVERNQRAPAAARRLAALMESFDFPGETAQSDERGRKVEIESGLREQLRELGYLE